MRPTDEVRDDQGEPRELNEEGQKSSDGGITRERDTLRACQPRDHRAGVAGDISHAQNSTGCCSVSHTEPIPFAGKQ